MDLRSIRWRLPLSYAAIALISVLALGTVLIVTLRGYYSRRERAYLVEKAQLLQLNLLEMFTAGLPAEALAGQVNTLAFFSQARVRLLGPEGELLVDSGHPTLLNVVAFSPLPLAAAEGMQVAVTKGAGEPGPYPTAVPFEAPRAGEAAGDQFGIYTVEGDAPGFQMVYVTGQFTPTLETASTSADLLAGEGRYAFITSIPAEAAFYGLASASEMDPSGRRSTEKVTLRFGDASGATLATLELSEGPAFGSAILSSVSQAWAAAGLFAVLLAGGVGWLISGQMTRPLTALTGVTHRMAAGDLAARADPAAAGEFGLLGQAFNGMAGRVEETVLTLRQFVMDAAHELKTPLTALRMDLELAAGEAASERQAALLQRAGEQVVRLTHLSEALLDLSRLEAARGLPEGAASSADQALPEVDPLALIGGLSEVWAAQAEQAGLNFSLELPEAAQPLVGNEIHLRRALQNLVENALKFTPPGGSVGVALRQAAGGTRITVSDTGIGIPPEDLARLFGRFHRGRNAAAYPGSGLGLAIVKAIVEGQGGRVGAASRLGEGTEVWVELGPAG